MTRTAGAAGRREDETPMAASGPPARGVRPQEPPGRPTRGSQAAASGRAPVHPRPAGSSGVTLLEVLVAAGLLGLLLGYTAFAWGHQARLARGAREETRMALVAQAQMEIQQANPIRPGDPPFSFTIPEGVDQLEYTGTYGSAELPGTGYYWTVTVVVDPRLPGRESFPLAAYVLNPEQWDLR